MKYKNLGLFLLSSIGFTLMVFAITEIISHASTVGRYEYKLGNIYLTLVILVVGLILNIIVYRNSNKNVK